MLARTTYDWNGAPAGYLETVEEAVKNTKMLADKYKEDDMVTVIPAPHSLHAASIEMIKAGHKLAKELGTCFHIHVAEEPFEVEQVKKEYDGLTPIELLDKIRSENRTWK
ncbi:MAG: amidohydrolase family protein [Clostridiaceae bacterium]